MVEVSRDGQESLLYELSLCGMGRAILSGRNSYVLVKADAAPDGSLHFDPKFFVTSNEHRLHQVHLDGGDTSSDSYCYPS